MNILITGGSGFVGKQIIKKLYPNNKLTLILRNKPDKKDRRINYIFTKNIFTKKKDWFLNKLKNIDMVIHCAWYVNHKDYLTSPKNLDCLNGTIEIAKACIEVGVKKFVGIGTCFEYDVSKKYLSTQTPLKPELIYSISKASTFLILSKLFENGKTQFKWCRLFYLFGEGEKITRLYPLVLHKLKNNQKIDIGPGNQIRDYLDVKKAAQQIINFSFSAKVGATNICSSKPITLKNFVLNIAKKKNKEHLVKFGSKMFNRKFDPKVIVGIK